MTRLPPVPDGSAGLRSLRALGVHFDMLGALRSFHDDLGDIFQIGVPGFRPVVLAGPEAARYMLVTDRQHFLWRPEGDAVTQLLRRGVLVVDGPEHDDYRRLMEPALRARVFDRYLDSMVQYTDQVSAAWENGGEVDMLVEMRRVALLILMRTLFGVDMTADIDRLWQPILRAIAYISPGLWMFWPGMPRPGYARPLRELDAYLYHIIRQRRLTAGDSQSEDLLGRLLAADLSDDIIRDQMITMLIAGHDTSTALLAWSFYLLGSHPPAYDQVRAEVDAALRGGEPSLENVKGLRYLDQVIKETLRLYPPIHIANRRTVSGSRVRGISHPGRPPHPLLHLPDPSRP